MTLDRNPLVRKRRPILRLLATEHAADAERSQARVSGLRRAVGPIVQGRLRSATEGYEFRSRQERACRRVEGSLHRPCGNPPQGAGGEVLLIPFPDRALALGNPFPCSPLSRPLACPFIKRRFRRHPSEAAIHRDGRERYALPARPARASALATSRQTFATSGLLARSPAS
jgi:hypothetical protein